ncbi:MAG: hypothetical protein HPY45_13815 [Anaerolineae bacterium]|nr:hypothetical protein [Anaerolineae bacterium]
MAVRCVIGCDIGSQGVKTVLLSAEGEILAEAGAGYAVDYPRPAWAEQPAQRWIEALETSIAEVLQTANVPGEAVAAIGLDGQVDGFVAVDAHGKPLYPAIIWMDRRALPQYARAAETLDADRIFRLSGLNLDPYHVALKIRWLAENEPRLYEAARYFLLPCSYVAYWLTGEAAVDYSNASSTLLMDITRRAWSAELCAGFDVPMERMPPIRPANAVIGGLRPQVAERLGLRPHIAVTVGCGDEHAACLGAGVIQPGLVCDIAGTAEPVAAASSQPLFDADKLVETHAHAHPDLWLMENPGFVSGGNYRWFRDQFSPQEVQQAARASLNPYDLLNQAAEGIPPGCEGLVMLPTLMGAVTPTWNALARGVFYGFSLSHRREHFIRAVMEASAYALRDITDQMQRMGLALSEIRAVGGGARSSLWRQIKADVCGLPVTLLQTVETTALGAALLGLHAGRLTASLEEGVQAVTRIQETRQPDPHNMRRYEEYYQLYRSLYFSLLPVFEHSAKIEAAAGG